MEPTSILETKPTAKPPKPRKKRKKKPLTQVQLNTRWRKKHKAAWDELKRRAKAVRKAKFPKARHLEEQKRLQKKKAKELLALYYALTGRTGRNERNTND